MISLKNVELFSDMTSIDENGIYIDLHNNYEFSKVIYDADKANLRFYFDGNDRNTATQAPNLIVEFINCSIALFEMNLDRSSDSTTLSNMYRGRFEKDDQLFEFSDSGSGYYYAETETGDKFELFAEDVNLYFAEA